MLIEVVNFRLCTELNYKVGERQNGPIAKLLTARKKCFTKRPLLHNAYITVRAVHILHDITYMYLCTYISTAYKPKPVVFPRPPLQSAVFSLLGVHTHLLIIITYFLPLREGYWLLHATSGEEERKSAQ